MPHRATVSPPAPTAISELAPSSGSLHQCRSSIHLGRIFIAFCFRCYSPIAFVFLLRLIVANELTNTTSFLVRQRFALNNKIHTGRFFYVPHLLAFKIFVYQNLRCMCRDNHSLSTELNCTQCSFIMRNKFCLCVKGNEPVKASLKRQLTSECH